MGKLSDLIWAYQIHVGFSGTNSYGIENNFRYTARIFNYAEIFNFPAFILPEVALRPYDFPVLTSTFGILFLGVYAWITYFYSVLNVFSFDQLLFNTKYNISVNCKMFSTNFIMNDFTKFSNAQWIIIFNKMVIIS